MKRYDSRTLFYKNNGLSIAMRGIKVVTLALGMLVCGPVLANKVTIAIGDIE